MLFRAIFLKQINNLLKIKYKDFFILKKIKSNKNKLDKLYKDILSSRTS